MSGLPNKDPIFSQQFDQTELTDYEKYMKHQQQASEPIPADPVMAAPSGGNDGAQVQQSVGQGEDASAEALHQILVVVTDIRDTLKQILA